MLIRNRLATDGTFLFRWRSYFPLGLLPLILFALPEESRISALIERACALADGPLIGVRDLPEHVRGRGRPAPARPELDLPLAKAREAWIQAFAEEYLSNLMRRHSGNVSQAARTAGIDRKTLHRLLVRHGVRS